MKIYFQLTRTMIGIGPKSKSRDACRESFLLQLTVIEQFPVYVTDLWRDSLGKTLLSFKSIWVFILGGEITQLSIWSLIFSPLINSNS